MGAAIGITELVAAPSARMFRTGVELLAAIPSIVSGLVGITVSPAAGPGMRTAVLLVGRRTVILVSHDTDQVQRLCDQVIDLDPDSGPAGPSRPSRRPSLSA